MTKIVAINASPRVKWNTAQLVREAAAGAQEQGAQVQVVDLYQLDKFTGCISCFACKLPAHEGQCRCKDGLTPVLDAIREADGLILGSPNYLGNLTAGFRALYERLAFQSLTYRAEAPCCNQHLIPILLITTSNHPAEGYDANGYTAMLEAYERTLGMFVGPTKTFVSGNTLQVSDYSRYNWTFFDIKAKQKRHEEIFPQELAWARELGAQLVASPWV